jgi:WXG100 family type VII secretion target
MSNSPISVDFQHLADLERQLTSASAEIESQLSALRSKLQQMEWDGPDRQAYQEAQARWDKAVTDLQETLASVGQAVQVASQGYSETEAQIVQSWQ